MAAVAWFVTPHGFGHAARASAIMAAWRALRPELRLELFTLVPEWFFRDQLGPLGYHPCACDVGLVQDGPMNGDLGRTVTALDALLPFRPELVASLAAEVRAAGCRLVVCDIAALGLVVAQAAGVPGVLVENFRWDYIYEPFLAQVPALARHCDYLAACYDAADVLIQVSPVCAPRPAALTTAVVARPARQSRQAVRAALGVGDRRLVLSAMGGFPTEYPFLPQLAAWPDYLFVVCGGTAEPRREGNLLCLPHRGGHHFPDLVQAADLVVSKAGYSTTAEVYRSGTPLAYVLREEFRESPTLGRVIVGELSNHRLTEEEFYRGAWLPLLPQLTALPRRPHPDAIGDQQAAAFLNRLLAQRIAATVGCRGRS